MPDASPTKWHRAHTTWFFEAMVLERHAPNYQVHDQRYGYLFNSYYEALGPRAVRAERGLITRPSADEIKAYRRYVDDAMIRQMEAMPSEDLRGLAPLIDLGLHHEQQHQELILTDIKHALSCNPTYPAYRPEPRPLYTQLAPPMEWLKHSGGIVSIGHDVNTQGFAFDNEGPPHQVFLQPFQFADRLVTCAEYLAFMEDGGYRRPELWLSEGWDFIKRHGREAPLYWLKSLENQGWRVFTLHGLEALNSWEPVSHVSFYEADAYARWAGKRLPTEFEWEAVAKNYATTSSVYLLHPTVDHAAGLTVKQLYNVLWQWTRSSYDPYPGFQCFEGLASEYNGKFMISQIVLRGGSCATPDNHIRSTYRNFFPPAAQWQFSGIRLAETL